MSMTSSAAHYIQQHNGHADQPSELRKNIVDAHLS
jgi:hypothetical protein